ncbi:MAG: DegT/DnrJ/EryC1/StrS family aminotransferase [Planctomycetota bacterium]|nr:DegT/DnrJ/EryC1/StrS family aminotransferase [Planctomycetota bacterium]
MSDLSVPMLDLKAQYASIKDEIDPAIAGVLESQWCIGGPEVQALEEEIAAYCGTSHAAGCASGTDAILMPLMAIGIKPGDEVICPTFTFFATAGCIVRLGGVPVFADIDPVTFNMTEETVRAAAARCTNLKAIIPVDLYGQAVDMDAMLKLGEEFGVPIIEDAAQAIGARDAKGQRVGSRGLYGCFSFYPTKNLGAMGDAGIITTKDPEAYDRLKAMGNHGMKPKYYHSEVGLNSRLDAIQAAVLRVKLKHLDQWSEKRASNAAFYDRTFAEAGAKTNATPLDEGDFPLRTPQPPTLPATHIYHQYVISVPGTIRDDLRTQLGKKGIGTEIYYPLSLHEQACFTDLGYAKGDLPVSELAAQQTIAIPIHPELSDAQLEYVTGNVIKFVNQCSPIAQV